MRCKPDKLCSASLPPSAPFGSSSQPLSHWCLEGESSWVFLLFPFPVTAASQILATLVAPSPTCVSLALLGVLKALLQRCFLLPPTSVLFPSLVGLFGKYCARQHGTYWGSRQFIWQRMALSFHHHGGSLISSHTLLFKKLNVIHLFQLWHKDWDDTR